MENTRKLVRSATINSRLKPDSFVMRYKSISELLKNYDPSKNEHRLPHVVFSGPTGLYNHRVPIQEFTQEIGTGPPSVLRSLDVGYLTRGKSGDIIKKRNNYPGEIGWSVEYFGNIYTRSVTCKQPDSFSIHR